MLITTNARVEMTKGQGKTGLIVTIVVLGVTLLVVGGIVFWQNTHRTTVETTNEPETSQTDTTKEDTPAATTPTDTDKTSTTPAVDPSTLKTIDIDPLGIAVSYTKGIPGFEFAVKRAADKSEYVQFSAPELVGTKCTNDEGSFASIIKNVSSSEDSSTISQKVTVAGTTYGLSLASVDCTSDVALLKQYQSAFSNGFSQLKAI
jgi:cytoskeletal protein RodZ